jgi:hypothetical protein
MGVTIHYEGQLKNLNALDELLNKIRAFAEVQHWPFQIINEPHKRLERFISNDDPDLDGEERIYEGPVHGITLNPHPDCESFTFEFDSQLFCQDYTKTQFAGPSIHRELIELLTDLEPLFVTLKVNDESEYWTERSERALEESFRRIDAVINDMHGQHPRAQIKVRTPAGRLVDIIT